MSEQREKILDLREVDVNYGPRRALRDISLNIRTGEIVSLLGANGAGKTTTLNAIYGLLPIMKGEILYQGESIQGVPPYRLVTLGIGYVTEEKTTFSPMSVMDNLRLGAYTRRGRDKEAEMEKNFSLIFNLFPVLEKRKQQAAGTLSGGELQMLSVGRILMSNPRLLLLDEPSLGLAPLVVSEMMHVIAELRKLGLSVFLVEQNARAALKIADRGYLMEGGTITTENTAEQLLCDAKVQSAYLGGTCNLPDNRNS